MNRRYLRVAALTVFLYLLVSPIASAAQKKDRDVIVDPGERVVRVIKKVRNFFRGLTTQDDGLTPPRP
jgi:hypothetical protein